MGVNPQDTANLEETEEGKWSENPQLDVMDEDLNPADEDFDKDVTPSEEELAEVPEPPEVVEPEEETPVGEPAEVEEDQGEEPDYLKIINDQAAEIALLKQGQKPETEETPEEETAVVAAPAVKTPAAKGKEIDFVGDLDIDDIAAVPETFNRVMNNVMDKAAELAAQKVLIAIPNVVLQQVTQTTQIQRAAEKFWADNDDLKPVTNMVTAAIEREAVENPGKSYAEIFQSAGDKIRKTLKLAKQAIDPQNPDDGTSTLPKKTTSRAQREVAKTKLQSEIDEMSDFTP